MKTVTTFGGEKLDQVMCGDLLEYFPVESLDEHKKVCESCTDNYAEQDNSDEILV